MDGYVKAGQPPRELKEPTAKEKSSKKVVARARRGRAGAVRFQTRCYVPVMGFRLGTRAHQALLLPFLRGNERLISRLSFVLSIYLFICIYISFHRRILAKICRPRNVEKIGNRK